METEKTHGSSGSTGLGLGLDINLRLGELRNTLTQLTDALQAPVEMVTDTLANTIRKLRDAGVQDLKSAREKEGGHGEASDTYNRMVAQLQDAARRGEDEARKLLGELGEKFEAAGAKTQEFAAKKPESHTQKR
ncbi:MAG: hypothetical protein HY900_28310 [Deltaproteobacteria bacterium]|nr:hypothetical protein [Deltaproteobacteria bacterium]